MWTADHDEHARDLAMQQKDFNENPFSDEHLQIRWAMMAKSELQADTIDDGASTALHDFPPGKSCYKTGETWARILRCGQLTAMSMRGS